MSSHLIFCFLTVILFESVIAIQNGVKISSSVVVRKDGLGEYMKISDAVKAAPTMSNGKEGYFRIIVKEGLYEEHVVIPNNKPYLMMIGDGMDRTIISGNFSQQYGYSILTSPTFTPSGSNFIAINMTIRNTAGPSKGQAVALMSEAKFSVFYKCSIEGYQDTLYVRSGKQLYRECNVYGTIDFIFGDATVVFQKCNLFARQPRKGNGNEITAQARKNPKYTTGIIIQGCVIKPTEDLMRSNYTVKTYLGRPWFNYSKTVIMEIFIDGFIEPAGWNTFSKTSRLDTLYYAEYNNTGPGSKTTNRVNWPGYHIINATVASNFTVSNFLDGDNWIPNTHVPYDGGLN